MALQKVLLMGKSGAGKTSMRSIIFANYLARDTMRLGATIDVEHSHVRFLGNLVLNLWDCGGQEAFMENYFELQRDHIFRNVQVLIYVFDIESRELAKDMEYYASCLQALKQNSKAAKVFCLVHKMDLIPEEQRDEVFRTAVRGKPLGRTWTARLRGAARCPRLVLHFGRRYARRMSSFCLSVLHFWSYRTSCDDRMQMCIVLKRFRISSNSSSSRAQSPQRTSQLCRCATRITRHSSRVSPQRPMRWSSPPIRRPSRRLSS